MTRVWAVADLLVAALVAAAVAVMVVDQVVHDAFLPTRYFAFFTIQTNLLDVVVLALGGWLVLRRGRQGSSYGVLRGCAVAYAVVTAVVYNALLRGIELDPGVYVTAVTWPNEVVHVVGPAYLALEWVLNRSRPRPGRRLVVVGLAYPVVWVVLTLVRGGLDGFYPYPFLDPTGPAGWAGVGAYVLGIAVFVTALLVLARAVARAPSHERTPDRGRMGP